jgi:hypothetical protein
MKLVKRRYSHSAEAMILGVISTYEELRAKDLTLPPEAMSLGN